MAKKTAARPALTDLVIDALEDIKGRDIKLFNVAKLTSVSDYIAIACGDSNRQTRALAKSVSDKVKAAGYQVYGSEGEETGEWVLVDCGDVVVHIMQPAIREYYKLEELWAEGIVEYPKPKPVAPVAKPVRKASSADDAVKKVASKKVAAKKVAAKKVAAKKPAAKKPAAKKPVAKAPVAKKPAAKKVAKKPAAATSAVKKPAAKKVAKKAA